MADLALDLPAAVAPTVVAPTVARRPLLEPPGGLLMWLIVGLELVVFGILFGLLAYQRASEPAMFRAGQRDLSPTHGLVLTLVLVTSGWLAAEAVHAFRAGRFARSRRCYLAAVVTGLGFVGLKVHDYAAKIGAGHGLGDDDFWDAYFLGTGFHFAHVLLGLALLALTGRRVGRATFEDAETAVAGTTLFWHMCDLAWFFLFALFYARA